MTTITATYLVASSDKKNMLPAVADPKHATNRPPQATAPELRSILLPRTSANRGKKGYCPVSSRALGFLAPLDASSVLAHRFGRLCPVAHPQLLVGGAQVLLDRRLRQVQAPGYLGVAQALNDHLQDLLLTDREIPNFGVLVPVQEVP